MSNQEHFNRLKNSTVDEWNQWRRKNDTVKIDLSNIALINAKLSYINLNRVKLGGANLVGADLYMANLQYADLRNAKLDETNLSKANLDLANLTNATLIGARLTGADLIEVKLLGATLTDADLLEVNLTVADLKGADLRGTNLSFVNFSGASLVEVDFKSARLRSTTFARTDLSNAKNLDRCDHGGPSTVDYHTIKQSGMLPDVFLRGCGLPDTLIEYYPSLLNKAISFYSCFISYSHEDLVFARRLHDQLQGRGIRCWLDEHQLLPGDDIFKQVDQGIKLWDKVLLCASESALTSWWVDNEIDRAFSKEQILMKQRKHKIWSLIPLDLDGYMFSDEWENGKADQVKSRLAADFNGWETDNAIFEEAFEKIVNALQTDNTGREAPPLPKL